MRFLIIGIIIGLIIILFLLSRELYNIIVNYNPIKLDSQGKIIWYYDKEDPIDGYVEYWFEDDDDEDEDYEDDNFNLFTPSYLNSLE